MSETDRELIKLAGIHDTPYYVYRRSVVADRFRELRNALPEEFSILYSMKANPHPEMCSELRQLGAGVEVASGGELKLAIELGWKPTSVLYVAPGKRLHELELAVDFGILAVVVESLGELERLDKVAKSKGKTVDVMLRVNRKEAPASAGEIMTGGPSKFGIDEEKLLDALTFHARNLQIRGIQCYSGSQVLVDQEIIENVSAVVEIVLKLEEDSSVRCDWIDVGGGLGVPYNETDRTLNIRRIGKAVREIMSKLDGGRRLFWEAGRFLVAESGTFVTRVVDVKESRGKKFAIVDGGMNAFTRPMFMGVRHRIRALGRDIARHNKALYTVAGPLCTPLDRFGTDIPLGEVALGDLLAIETAGAYGHTMSMHSFSTLPVAKEIVI